MVLPRAAKPQAARFNYFIGDDASRWASDVPSFGMIVYENIYNGIDLHVMGAPDARGVLKYEFHCAPGADHTQIRIHYDGIDALCVDEASGALIIETSFGSLRDTAPIVWQETGGTGVPPVDRSLTLPARFETLSANTYTIALDETPDPSLPLVIDPEIEWMTYLGGTGFEFGSAVAIDGTDGMRVCGATLSRDFAGRSNSYHGGGADAFALKVDASSGQLEWMTYLGGSGHDEGYGIAVDSAGAALVSGSTRSTDFAGRNNSHYGGGTDAFALKVSPSGQLQWMTYLGGSGRDSGRGIAVDSAGSALVTGSTRSTDFAGRNNSNYGEGDAFALKVSTSGQVEWMTYLGGDELDSGYGIAVDSAGNAFVTGATDSTDFAGRNNSSYGDLDAYVLQVSSAGQLQWMTYLGGSWWDKGHSITVDGAGAALVTGETDSEDFLGRNNSYNGGMYDAFALKVSPSGQLQWMTYLGGSGWDAGYGIAVDGAGNALVTGITGSTDFAGRNNSHHGGGSDAFALKVSPSGQLQWMTYLGGSRGEGGWGIAVDSADNALVTGDTSSTDFAGRNNSYYGGGDAFIVKLRLPGAGPRLSVEATCPSGGPIRIAWEGATPNRQVALIFALNTGSVAIPQPNPCAGTRLGLGANQIQLVWQGSSGSTGSRTLNAQAPSGACGGYMQLLDIATCATSNVARVE